MRIVNSDSEIEKKKELRKRNNGKKEEYREQRLLPEAPLFSKPHLRFFKRSLHLETFTMNEMKEGLESSRSKAKNYLNSLVYCGLVREITYQGGTFYLVQRERIKKICQQLLSYVEELETTHEEETFRKAKEIQLTEEQVKRLLNRNGRSISFVDFDDQIGPLLKYKVLRSNFTSEMEKKPGTLAKIVTALSLDAKEITLSEGTSLLCKRIGSVDGEKKRFILIEKMKNEAASRSHDLIEELGKSLDGKEFHEENIRNVLSSCLSG